MWDEIAALAWIDPSLITKKETRFMSVDIDHGAGYGNTLTWHTDDKPRITLQPVEIQFDLDLARFMDMFASLMTKPVAVH
jgi:inosine-uridine nucleoside N-ribohydrolase